MNSRTNLTILLILGLHLHVFAQESSKELTTKYAALEITAKDLQSAEELVDQLVLTEGKASNEPVLSPGVADKSPEYTQRFKKVQDAFGKLTELKVKAFPVLVKHLEDKQYDTVMICVDAVSTYASVVASKGKTEHDLALGMIVPIDKMGKPPKAVYTDAEKIEEQRTLPEVFD